MPSLNIPSGAEPVNEKRRQNDSPKCTECEQKSIERDDFEKKYKLEMEQRKDLKKVYLNLTVRFSELHSKYTDLLKTVGANRRHINTDEETESSTASSADIFTPNEVKFFKCLPLDKKTDCTLILNCLKYAYKPDPSVLASKTLKGVAEWTQLTDDGEIHHSAKTPLSPVKVDRMKGLFADRISKCQIDSAEFSERMKDSYINKLIAAGIRNLSKKNKK